jgi:hypothetical protein
MYNIFDVIFSALDLEKQDHASWPIDLGCSAHIIHNPNLVDNLEYILIDSIMCIAGNETVLPAKGT